MSPSSGELLTAGTIPQIGPRLQEKRQTYVCHEKSYREASSNVPANRSMSILWIGAKP